MVIECKNCGHKISQWDSINQTCPECLSKLVDENDTLKYQNAVLMEAVKTLLTMGVHKKQKRKFRRKLMIEKMKMKILRRRCGV